MYMGEKPDIQSYRCLRYNRDWLTFYAAIQIVFGTVWPRQLQNSELSATEIFRAANNLRYGGGEGGGNWIKLSPQSLIRQKQRPGSMKELFTRDF